MTTPGPIPSSGIRALEGLIRGLSGQRISTAELWDAIRSSGIPADFASVNQMRSAAVSLRNSMEKLNSASASDTLVSNMIGRSYYKGTPASGASIARYQINIPYSYTDQAGNEISSYLSSTVTNLPATVGDLFDLADNAVDESDSTPPGATTATGISIQRIF